MSRTFFGETEVGGRWVSEGYVVIETIGQKPLKISLEETVKNAIAFLNKEFTRATFAVVYDFESLGEIVSIKKEVEVVPWYKRLFSKMGLFNIKEKARWYQRLPFQDKMDITPRIWKEIGL